MELYNSRMSTRVRRKKCADRGSLCKISVNNSPSFALILSALGDELDTSGLRWVLRDELELLYFNNTASSLALQGIDMMMQDTLSLSILLRVDELREACYNQLCDISLVLCSCLLEVGVNEDRCIAVTQCYDRTVAVYLMEWSGLFAGLPNPTSTEVDAARRYAETAKWALQAFTVPAPSY